MVEVVSKRKGIMHMKNVLSKKMLLTVVASILVSTAAIGTGIYAWFTSSAQVEIQGDFNAGNVVVTAVDGELLQYDFYPGHQDSIAQQIKLEAVVLNDSLENTVDRNEAFTQWIADSQATLAWNMLEADEATDKTKLAEGAVNLIVNPFSRDAQTGHIPNVTPGSMLVNNYNFRVDESTIVTYFRISAAEILNVTEEGVAVPVEQAEADKILLQAASISANVGEGGKQYPLTYHAGYFYCDVPLMPGSINELYFNVAVYILGDVNETQKQITYTFAGGSGTIELIQATNNAVYQVEGWKDVVGADGFDYMPYTDTAAYQAWLVDWGFAASVSQP